MTLLWRGGPVEHHGRFFNVPATESLVTSVRQPHPRVWIGGGSDAAIRRAARLGHAWFPGGGDTEMLAQRQAFYHSALEEYGNPVPPDFPLGMWAYVAEDEEQALAEAHRYLAPQQDEAEFRTRARTQMIVGTPEQCVERASERVHPASGRNAPAVSGAGAGHDPGPSAAHHPAVGRRGVAAACGIAAYRRHAVLSFRVPTCRDEESRAPAWQRSCLEDQRLASPLRLRFLVAPTKSGLTRNDRARRLFVASSRAGPCPTRSLPLSATVP